MVAQLVSGSVRNEPDVVSVSSQWAQTFASCYLLTGRGWGGGYLRTLKKPSS